MTTDNMRRLAEFVSSLLHEEKLNKAKYPQEALSQIRNILSSFSSPYSNINQVLKDFFDAGNKEPWEHAKGHLLREPKDPYDNRAKYVYECGVIITAELSELPLLIGKYPESHAASAILEWRIRNKI